MAWTSPARRSRSTPRSTGTPKKLLPMPRISSSGAPPDLRAAGAGLGAVDASIRGWSPPRVAVRSKTQRVGAGRLDDRGRDVSGALAVGEGGEPVGGNLAADGGVGSRQRTRRSSRCSPAGDRRAGRRRGRGPRRIATPARGGRRSTARVPPTRRFSVILLVEVRSSGFAAIDSSKGEGCSCDRPRPGRRRGDPSAPRSVRNMTPAWSSVVTSRRAPVLAPPSKALPPRVRVRAGTAVWSRAVSSTIRWPVTNSTRSHQCEPMSANARGTRRQFRVDAPVVILRRHQPVLQVSAMKQTHVPDVPGSHPGARLPYGGVVAVDEGTVATAPASAADARQCAAPAASVASGFSQTTCLPPLTRSATGTWRWLGVQT